MKRDRRAALRAAGLNGVDFVEVADATEKVLAVHFLNDIDIGAFTARPTITGGETIPSVTVKPFPASGPVWSIADGHRVLRLDVAAPGDFSNYTLTLVAPNLDPFFGAPTFSFKAGCPSDIDCAASAPACAPDAGTPPRIDYLAKDFLSFRQTLLDYSTQYYPAWQERSEADFGMMFLEALSALGDELSYLQDRIAREATLATASDRRSITRHARLVGYEPGRTLSARVMLQFEAGSGSGTAPAGLRVYAPGADGTRIVFETGGGISGAAAPAPFDAHWDRASHIRGYWFDDSARCLPSGATSMYVADHGHVFQAGQTLLIETEADEELAPPVRQLVQLLGYGDSAGPWAIETVDRAFPISASPGGAPRAITRIAWIATDAIVAARDLSKTSVIGNIVPATQGQTVSESFAIATGAAPAPGAAPFAIERAGPSPTGGSDDRPIVRMWTLANAPIAWLASADGSSRAPEIRVASDDGQWSWWQTLLESAPTDTHFTLDPAVYRALPVNSDGSVPYEYDSDGGDTLRFGDGVFGLDPQPGKTFFVTYRAGAGAAGNVAADAINQIDAGQASPFQSVANPFAARGGADAETLISVQRNAPQAFRNKMLRAVTDDDYVAAAKTLAWVKRAGCARRWTGSWLTTFVTPQPVNSEIVLAGQREQLITLLDSMRMAGVEVYAPDPDYVAIDLRIELCVQSDAFAPQVQQAVMAALAPAGASNSSAFFAVGRFGFGQPLYRGDLEAAIQAAPGVAGVTRISYRLRDRWLGFQDMGNAVAVGAAQILRCDNDKSRPAAGALSIAASGGR